jgi:hypothetical protein
MWLTPSMCLFGWLTFLAFVVPIGPDEAVYKIVATGIFDGHWPYRDLFVNRQPLIFFWYLPAGLGASIVVERLIATAALVASVPVMSVVAKRWLRGRQVRLALISYCLLLANPILLVDANTEAFLLLPLLAAMVAPSAFLAGVLLGIAVMTKLTAVAFLPLIVVIWKRDLWRVAAGTLAVCVVVSLPFVPIWHDYWVANVSFNFSYGQFSAGERLHHLFWFHPGVLLGAAPIWAAAVVGAVRTKDRFIWLWLLCGLAAVKATGYDFMHYYALLVPPAAILAAQGLDYLLTRRRLGIYLLAPTAALTLWAISDVVLSLAQHQRPFTQLVTEIDSHEGELYVLGGYSEIYIYADRQPERRLFFSVPLVMRADWGRQTRDDLLSCPPRVLVIPARNQFPVAWADDISSRYASRADFAKGSVFTQPLIECARPGR